MQQNIQKPLIIEIDEAKQELVQCVNDILQRHGLNCYLIEPAFTELYTEIKATAKRELAQAKAQMKQSTDNIASKEESI